MQKLFFSVAALLSLTFYTHAQTNRPQTAAATRASLATSQNPIVRLGNIEADNATIQQLSDNLKTGLTIARAANHKVVSYMITIIPLQGDTRISKTIKGGKILQDVYAQMKLGTIKKGDKIIFENIRILDDQNRQRNMSPVMITAR